MHLPPGQGASLKAPSSATLPFTPPPAPAPLGHPPFLPLQMLTLLSKGNKASTTLTDKCLHSEVCSPPFWGCHHLLALTSYCWVAFRDLKRAHQAIDAHETNALLPLACFLQLFLQETEAGCWVKRQNSMLEMDGTIGKINRVIVTARGETAKYKTLFVLPFF